MSFGYGDLKILSLQYLQYLTKYTIFENIVCRGAVSSWSTTQREGARHRGMPTNVDHWCPAIAGSSYCFTQTVFWGATLPRHSVFPAGLTLCRTISHDFGKIFFFGLNSAFQKHYLGVVCQKIRSWWVHLSWQWLKRGKSKGENWKHFW